MKVFIFVLLAVLFVPAVATADGIGTVPYFDNFSATLDDGSTLSVQLPGQVVVCDVRDGCASIIEYSFLAGGDITQTSPSGDVLFEATFQRGGSLVGLFNGSLPCEVNDGLGEESWQGSDNITVTAFNGVRGAGTGSWMSRVNDCGSVGDFVGSTTISVDSFSPNVVATPEANTAPLLLVGVAVALLKRR
jgi:hypothetical protein